MSTWDVIEGVIMAQPVVLPLTQRELQVVQEAYAAWVRDTLDEASAWDILARIELLEEADEMTAAVKGLDPKEVNLVRHFKANAKSRTGNTGEVMALTPKEWQRIKQEIEANPEYYDKLLGTEVSAGGLASKIGDQLKLSTGIGMGPSKLMHPEVQPQPPPVQKGTPFAKTTPSAQSPEERRRRVAAQDAAMMGGQTKPIGKVKVQGEKVEGNKLIKKTTRPGSISLELDEYEGIMSGQIEFVDVVSMAGKLVKRLTGAQVKGNILKGLAGVRQVDDDPTKPSYWYVRI